MKYSLLFFLFLVTPSKPSFGQAAEPHLTLEKSNRGNHHFLMKNDAIIDSILLTYANEILLDYKVISENKVLFIKKNPLGWYYHNVTKRDGQWERSISSGVIASDYTPSAYIKEREKAREYYRSLKYTILEEDKILVSGPKGEHIFDCNIIAERKREYLNRLKELQKN